MLNALPVKSARHGRPKQLTARHTLLTQAMHYIEEKTGAIIPLIYTSTTYGRDAIYENTDGCHHAREGNPAYHVPWPAGMVETDLGKTRYRYRFC